MTRDVGASSSDRCLVDPDRKVTVADAGSDCEAGVPQSLVSSGISLRIYKTLTRN